jgi:Domain of Unknown Function (DUF748)
MKWKVDFHSVWRRSTHLARWFVIVAVVLITCRLALPYVVKAYVNHLLNEGHDYTGQVGGIQMELWRGGYQIRQIKILKRTGGIPSPLFSASLIDLSIQWRELFHGAVVGKVALEKPQVNFVMGSTPGQTQVGTNESWNKILQGLFPFNLNRVAITNGQIHFQNPSSQPPVDIYLSQLSATATNLTNTRDLKQQLPSGLRASGTTIGGGRLDFGLRMNLQKPEPTFQLNCSLTNVTLTALNNFFRSYGKFDVAHGKFSLFTSAAAANGSYDGYFKVFFDDLDVFAWEKERKKNILKIFWDAIVGGVTEVFKNHPKNQLATKIPISGSYTNSNIGVWTATATLLQNAFIRALVPKLDQHITVEQVKKDSEKK